MNKPKVKKSLYLSKDIEGNLIIHLNSKNKCKITDNVDFIKKLIILMDGSLTTSELIENLKKYGYSVSNESLNHLLEMFKERNFIEETIDYDTFNLTSEELKKYDRQLNSFALYGNNSFQDALRMQSKLKEKKICVIGVGGVGCHSLYGFAAMGIGKITAVDFDKVELSNTARQMLYWESDIGRYKVDVAKEKLEKINPRVEYNFINKRITNVADVLEVAQGSDLIYLCADTPRGEIIDIVDAAAYELSIPYYVGSPITDHIMCGPIILPDNEVRYRDLVGNNLVHDDEDIQFLKQNVMATIIEPFNALSANLGVLEVIKFFTNYSECNIIRKTLRVDLVDMTMEIIDYKNKE